MVVSYTCTIIVSLALALTLASVVSYTDQIVASLMIVIYDRNLQS
jgi:hypothetical protein